MVLSKQNARRAKSSRVRASKRYRAEGMQPNLRARVRILVIAEFLRLNRFTGPSCVKVTLLFNGLRVRPRLQAGVNESTTGVLKYLNGAHKLIATGSK